LNPIRLMRAIFLFIAFFAVVAGLTPQKSVANPLFKFVKVYEHVYDVHGRALYPGRTKLIKSEVKEAQAMLRMKRRPLPTATGRPND